MEGFSYQSVAVICDGDCQPMLALPDVDSAAVVAARIADVGAVRIVPVVQLPWFPVQQQAQEASSEGVDTDGR